MNRDATVWQSSEVTQAFLKGVRGAFPYAADQLAIMCQQNQQTQGLCPQYSFSASTNQITDSGYTYDASGDLTSDGSYTYQYDAEGRLVSVDNGSTASYVYNALGERVEKDVGGVYTEYAFDKDGEPEAENNRGSVNNGWVDSWVNFEGQHIAHYENNGVYYIYSNQVGTAGFVTDWTGAVIQDELHYPWGKVWTTMGTQTEERFARLHHRDPATNLDPTHFRMYSSDEGRWLTPDPAQADIYNPQSMSRYAYADLNPLRLVDPLGSVTKACNETSYGYTISYCTTVTAPPYDPPINSFGAAALGLAGQYDSFLESGSFYGEWFGSATLVGGIGAAEMYPGGVTAVFQAAGSWAETYFPGSVGAATEFVSGLAGNAELTVAGTLGALTSEASNIVDEGENVGSDVWGWFKNLLC